MANSLASFGLRVAYLGNLGYPNLHPVFEEFSHKADVHSIADPGLTDALEFEDGKVPWMAGQQPASQFERVLFRRLRPLPARFDKRR